MQTQERRRAIAEAVDDLTDQAGYPPLRREIAEHTGMDLKTVRRYLRELLDEGVLEEPGEVGTRTLRRPR